MKHPAILRKLFTAAAIIAPLTFFAGCDDDGDSNPVSSGSDLPDGWALINDESVQEGETLELDADTVYLLDGFVFVEDGATIKIPAGTVIRGNPGGGLNSSALIISRGGKIMAEGTKDNPIIMTARSDDLSLDDDLSGSARGLWGGLIILGKAPITTSEGTEQIEGIIDDPRGEYGGSMADDNSGTVKYVSIRYGGTNIGEGNEINGLTMGGVGNGTTIEYVEVYNNKDDGFEWFGGTVNTKHLLAAGCADDSYDWDQGFNGKGQFWVVVQGDDDGDRAVEADGTPKGALGTGYSQPTIYNATFVGSGAGSDNAGNMIFKLREETGAFIYNSIFTDFYGDLKIKDGALTLVGVLNFDDGKATEGNSVTQHVLDGELDIANCIFNEFSNDASEPKMLIKFSGVDDQETKDSVVAIMTRKNYWGVDAGVTRSGLVPEAGGEAFTNERKALPSGDDFFSTADYIGAFKDSNWLEGWSFYAALN